MLARCVQPCHVVVGRRLHSSNWPFDDALGPTLLLFPGLHAAELQTWHNEAMAHGECVETIANALPQGSDVMRNDGDQNEHNDAPAEQMNEEFLRTGSDEGLIFGSQAQIITLVVVDGTWEHAQEMVKASLPFLSHFVTQVCLPFDIHSDGHGVGESDLIIRKEPFGGCVSTMEAVARALAILEPNGDVLETKLMEVLRQMVSLQASHFGAPKIRPKLKKKSKQ